HFFSAGRYRVRDSEVDDSLHHSDQFYPPTDTLIPQVSIQTTTVQLEISTASDIYSTCRDSTSNTEPTFTTFKTGFKLSSDKTSDPSNSTFGHYNITSGTTVDSSYSVTSHYTDYSNFASGITDYYLNNRVPSGTAKQRDCLDWTSENPNNYYQSTDSSATTQQNTNPPSSNHPKSQYFHSEDVESGSIVYNLLSSSGPTLQEVSRIEASFSQLEENSKEGRTFSNVAITNTGAKEVKGKICKSRLPVRLPGRKLCSQSQPIVKDRAQDKLNTLHLREHAMHKVRERVDPFENLFPKSRIPVIKAMKLSSCPKEQQKVRTKFLANNSRIQTTKGNTQLSKCKSSTEPRYSVGKIPSRSSTNKTGPKKLYSSPKKL
ncbi:uncharacterized protein LKV04_020440, partial [Tautogolabrus adspersus]